MTDAILSSYVPHLPAETDTWLGREVTLSCLATNLKDKITGEPVLGVLCRPVRPPAAAIASGDPPTPAGRPRVQ